MALASRLSYVAEPSIVPNSVHASPMAPECIGSYASSMKSHLRRTDALLQSFPTRNLKETVAKTQNNR